MSSMALPRLEQSADHRVLAGVCGGIADALDVDPTLVRLVFTLLALAGGAGIALYAALWFYMRGHHWIALVPLLLAGSLVLHALGLSTTTTVAVVLITVGLALLWRHGASLRPGEPLSLAGIVLTATGAGLLLTRGGTSFGVLAPGAVVGALLLIVGPWLWQLARERDAERTARIRSEERADVAARVHDSVLQTLALVQRHANEPRRVASLARRQERELRSWLYGHGAMAGDTLEGALAAAADEIEELHGVRVELASGGDCPLTDDVRAVVLAAREAMANAAKFSGAGEISVYAEADDSRVSVFVRDRGAGFDRASVPDDRRGLSESIEGRMARAGGSAMIASTPGEGTEVELRLPLVPVRSEA
jgi:signal transduction histidine kinase